VVTRTGYGARYVRNGAILLPVNFILAGTKRRGTITHAKSLIFMPSDHVHTAQTIVLLGQKLANPIPVIKKGRGTIPGDIETVKDD